MLQNSKLFENFRTKLNLFSEASVANFILCNTAGSLLEQVDCWASNASQTHSAWCGWPCPGVCRACVSVGTATPLTGEATACKVQYKVNLKLTLCNKHIMKYKIVLRNRYIT